MNLLMWNCPLKFKISSRVKEACKYFKMSAFGQTLCGSPFLQNLQRFYTGCKLTAPENATNINEAMMTNGFFCFYHYCKSIENQGLNVPFQFSGVVFFHPVYM